MADMKIEFKKDCLVWITQIKKPGKNLRVLVPEGCRVIGMVNGEMISDYTSNELFNENNNVVKRYGKDAEYLFYVFNTTAEVKVKWGVGKSPITYADKRLHGMLMKMSAYGYTNVRITDAQLLLQKMPGEVKSDGVITAEEIQDFIQRELIAKVAPLITDAIASIGDYTVISAKKNEISDKITFGIEGLNKYGMRTSNTVIEGLNYMPESLEAIEKANAIADSKMDTEITGERSKQIKMMKDAASGGAKED